MNSSAPSGDPRDGRELPLLHALVVEDEWPARNYLVELLQASRLGEVDYLLKPFTEERVEQCLRRLQSRRPARTSAPPSPSKIVARRKKGLVFLRPDEVWAFEAADRLTFVHTPRGKFDLDLSLSAI